MGISLITIGILFIKRRREDEKTVLAVVGIVGFSGVLATQQAFAEDINVNYTSNGAITFEPDTDPTKPVNQPIQMKKLNQKIQLTQLDQNQGLQAPLSIDYASSFQFAPKKSLPIRKIITHKFKHLKMGQQVPTMFR